MPYLGDTEIFFAVSKPARMFCIDSVQAGNILLKKRNVCYARDPTHDRKGSRSLISKAKLHK